MPTTTLPSGQVLRSYSDEGTAPRVMTDRAKAHLLRNQLSVLLSVIDYSRGACSARDPVSMLVKPDYLETIRDALEMTK